MSGPITAVVVLSVSLCLWEDARQAKLSGSVKNPQQHLVYGCITTSGRQRIKISIAVLLK